MATDEHALRQTKEELLRVARLSRIYYPRRFDEAWSPAELQVLRHLAQPGTKTDTGRAIARQLALDPGTVSASIKLLRERRMMVVDDDLNDDGETVVLRRITIAGEDLLDRHLKDAHDRHVEWVAGRDDWEQGVRYR